MRGGARLDCARLIDTTRDAWRSRGDWIDGHVGDDEFRFGDGGVIVDKWDLVAQKIVLCRGASEVLHPAGSGFPNGTCALPRERSSKCEIPGWTDHRIVHKGMWLAPSGDGTCRAGATYDWNGCGSYSHRGSAARDSVAVAKLCRPPIETLGQCAAVRPTPRAYRPLVAVHPAQPRLAVFNGLGSRGALQAPLLAKLCERQSSGGERFRRTIDRWRGEGGGRGGGASEWRERSLGDDQTRASRLRLSCLARLCGTSMLLNAIHSFVVAEAPLR